MIKIQIQQGWQKIPAMPGKAGGCASPPDGDNVCISPFGASFFLFYYKTLSLGPLPPGSSTGLWGRPFEKLGKRCQQMSKLGTHFFCLPTDKLLFIRYLPHEPDNTIILPCDHKYFDFKQTQENCKAQIFPSKIREILAANGPKEPGEGGRQIQGPQAVEQYNQRLLDNFMLSQKKNFCYCPNPKCDNIVRIEKGKVGTENQKKTARFLKVQII
ncbi:MAG: hypothetical protein EZS28_014544 [Streblomastix strix]|uniref:Uncharacterized protein n=1 Tax=Streblomastix strix TaxID=222440 RepID=A0A5J4W4S8_9EUKA|nr:MAG: hypothetical protein EZS28_014544 [Streblomastix strix]